MFSGRCKTYSNLISDVASDAPFGLKQRLECRLTGDVREQNVKCARTVVGDLLRSGRSLMANTEKRSGK